MPINVVNALYITFGNNEYVAPDILDKAHSGLELR
jgi:hypothetical protein